LEVIALLKVDMSSATITARLKRVGGLSDAERRATVIRNLVAEIRPEGKASLKPRKKKKPKHASIHS
jgi:hypothetical protein